MRRRRVATALAAALTVGLLGAPGAPPAAAAPRAAQTVVPGGIRLASQTPWVAPDGEFQVRVRVSDRLRRDGVELAVVVYQRLRTRSAFALTLEDRIVSSPQSVTAAPVTEMTADPGGAYVVRLPLSSGARAAEPGAPRPILLRREGVYPVRVEVREEGGGRVLAGLTTHLLRLPSADDLRPLSVAWIQPVEAPPAHTPDGSVELPAERRDRLATVVDALAARTVPLTVAPRPETVAALLASDAGDGDAGDPLLETLRRSLDERQVLGGPWAGIDLRTLVAADLEDEIIAHLARGADALRAGLGVRADVRTWLASPSLDPVTAGVLRRLGVDRLVVPDAALEPVDLSVTLTNPFLVEAGTGRLTQAMSADGGLAGHFPGADDDPVLQAHRLLADLAVLYFDRPGLTRGVVVSPPATWTPTRSFLDTALHGLAASPVLEPVTLDELFDDVPPAESAGEALVRELAPEEPDPLGVPATAVRAARARLVGFASMIGPDNPAVASAESTLLLATADGVAAEGRRRYLSAAGEAIDDEIAEVRAASQGITLTAREGTIPLTFQNLAGYPVTVSVELDSDKLDFPDGSVRQLVLEQRNTTVEVDVRARTSGAFPLRVTVTSPDRRLLVHEARLTIRSTAVSGVGLLLMGGAAIFLLAWWANHIRTGRRDRRLVGATG